MQYKKGSIYLIGQLILVPPKAYFSPPRGGFSSVGSKPPTNSPLLAILPFKFIS
jgi:hypothetical protein